MLSDADRTLIQRSDALVEELGDFLTVRDETDPLRSGSLDTAVRPQALGDALIRDGLELHTTYATRFAGRAAALREAFKQRGIEPQGSVPAIIFERPTSPGAVRMVMGALARMAEQLRLRG